jgi:hypothetical protein
MAVFATEPTLGFLLLRSAIADDLGDHRPTITNAPPTRARESGAVLYWFRP